MKKSERAEALYKAMKVKNELEKRNKTDKTESLSDSDTQLRDEIEPERLYLFVIKVHKVLCLKEGMSIK